MDSVGDLLDNCAGYKLLGLATSIAIVLAENLDLDDQNVIGNLIVGVGTNLLIIAAQNSKFQACVQTCKENQKAKIENKENQKAKIEKNT